MFSFRISGDHSPEYLAALLIARYIDAFIQAARTTKPHEQPEENFRLRANRSHGATGYRLKLQRTAHGTISYTVRSEPYVLGLLIDRIWEHEGATTNAVNRFTLEGEIPIPPLQHAAGD